MKNNKTHLMIYIILMATLVFSGCSEQNQAQGEVFTDYSNESMNAYTYETVPTDTFADITLMTVSDIHYFSHSLHDDGEAFKRAVNSSNGQMLNLSVEIFNQFTLEVIETMPDYLLITGDLTYNGEQASHEELAALLNQVESHGIDVLVVPGNHDINNVYARAFTGSEQVVTPYISYDDFENLYADFGPNIAIMKDETTFSYVIEHGNTWLLMLDSNQYENNINLGYPETGGAFKEQQAVWLNEVFERAQAEGKEMIAAMHHNIVPHADVSPLFMYDFMVSGATAGLSEYLASQDINLFFSGHIHCHDIAGIRYEDDFIYDVTTGALTVYPHNYRICNLSADGTIAIDSKRIEELEGQDFGKLTFGEYSKDLAYAIKDFGVPEGVSDKDSNIMAQYATEVANAYFEGRDYEFSLDTTNSIGYNLWKDYPENTPQKHFIIGMSKDTEPRDNHVVIDLNSGYWETKDSE